MTRRAIEIIHEGRRAAEIGVDLIDEDGGWAPYFSLDDARKIETVRRALRESDLAGAAQIGRVFELVPVGA